MKEDELAQFGAKALREFAAFADQLQQARGTDEADAQAAEASARIVNKTVFVIDETTALLEGLRRQLTGEAASEKPAPPDPENNFNYGRGLAEMVQLLFRRVLDEPETMARHYGAFARDVLNIVQGQSDLESVPRDFRFKDSLWQENDFFRTLLQLYLAVQQLLQNWLADQPFDEADAKRGRLLLDQVVAAAAPSNLPLNPAALKRADRTEGASMIDGMTQWLDDLVHHGGMPRQVLPDAFEVGRNLAVSEGAVVFRNAQLELIQYAPSTDRVRRCPVLLLPPQINKYYIFDLQPKNSILGHLVAAGLQVFTLSWRNPGPAAASWDLDTYVRAVIDATDAIRAITRSRRLNLISACAGGLTALSLLGYLAMIGDRRIRSHSLLVTCVFANWGSDLELFATPEAVEKGRLYAEAQGLMYGEELAQLFFWLRPNDLVWRYWINNYLLGKRPPPLDVLYWDNDSTRLPAALHGDFINLYRDDVFHRPGALKILGREIDFRRLRVDSYVVGGEDDYIMPWRGCYHAYRHFAGHHRFVLSPSGHVQSILRPPRLANVSYYVDGDDSGDADHWRATAARHDGTWWGDWHGWLRDHGGADKQAPRHLGGNGYPPLADAPGTYVFE